MKRHLVIATDNFLPRWDGIARFLAEIIPRLLDEYKITVISPDYGRSTLDSRIKRVRIPVSKQQWGDYTPARWKAGIIKSTIKQADIVFSQTIGPIGMLANRYSRKYKKPLAAFIHSIEWELVPKALATPLFKRLAYSLAKYVTRRLYNRCNLLIVPSESVAEKLSWERIRTKKRIVHLGVNTRKFTKGSKKQARKQLRLPQDALIIGFHGRLGYEKNLLTLSRAFLRLKHKEKRLLLIGNGVEGLKRKLQRVKGVLLPGAKDDIVPWLQAMDIYVMPSFTETTSLAVLEAMSCELPVVSSSVGFIKQYIKDGENGYFFDNKNAFELSVKLQFLADDIVLRERVGRAARKTVTKDFVWDKTAEKIGAALKGVKR